MLRVPCDAGGWLTAVGALEVCASVVSELIRGWGSCCVEPWLFLRAVQGTLRRILHHPSSTLSLRPWVDN